MMNKETSRERTKKKEMTAQTMATPTNAPPIPPTIAIVLELPDGSAEAEGTLAAVAAVCVKTTTVGELDDCEEA